MKRFEFWENRQNGPIMIENLETGEIEAFNPKSEYIDFLLKRIEEDYPEAYSWLKENYKNHANHRFIMALRFLKCNFSENDKTCDLESDGGFNIEDVHCPLKREGLLCQAQNIVCHPKLNSQLTDRELEYVPFLISGLDTIKISNLMCVSHFTVENTRKKIYRKLGFDGKTAIAQLTAWALKNNIQIANQ